jgi:hypothetical protein
MLRMCCLVASDNLLGLSLSVKETAVMEVFAAAAISLIVTRCAMGDSFVRHCLTKVIIRFTLNFIAW